MSIKVVVYLTLGVLLRIYGSWVRVVVDRVFSNLPLSLIVCAGYQGVPILHAILIIIVTILLFLLTLRVNRVNLSSRVLTPLGRLPMIWVVLGELRLQRKVRLRARPLRILVGRLIIFIVIQDISFYPQTV